MNSKVFYKIICLIALIELCVIIFQNKYYFIETHEKPKFCSTFTNETCLLDMDEPAESFVSRYKEYCESHFHLDRTSDDCYGDDEPLCDCVPDSANLTDEVPLYKKCSDGFLRPSACVPRHKTAIIVPFRDRHHHLEKLSYSLHKMLRRQLLSYQLFVVEQSGTDVFNKAVLMNTAFKEISARAPKRSNNNNNNNSKHNNNNRYDVIVSPTNAVSSSTSEHNHSNYNNNNLNNNNSDKYSTRNNNELNNRNNKSEDIAHGHLKNKSIAPNKYSGSIDCYIFHDVDMLPLPPFFNFYVCVGMPRHIGTFQDHATSLLYEGIFGGVTGFSMEQFRKINGFSNSFWGWGGEDDDLLMRVKAQGMKVNRFPHTVAQYHMISHTADGGNPGSTTKERAYKFDTKKYANDGLNTLEYKLLKWTEEGDYQRLLVKVPNMPSKYATFQRLSWFNDNLHLELNSIIVFFFILSVIVLIIYQRFFVVSFWKV